PSVAYRSGWSVDGGGVFADRSVDRATYGVGDLQMFSAAVRQCLEDIKGRGLRRWWDRDIGGLNIGFDADPVEDVLAVGDANFGLSKAILNNPRLYFEADTYLEFARADSWYRFALDGVIRLELEADCLGPGTAGMDLGLNSESAERWQTVFAENLDLEQTDGHGVINDLKPAVDDSSSLGVATRRWEFLRVSKDAVADRDVVAAHDVVAGAGLYGISLELTGFVTSSLIGSPTGTHDLGTDALRWGDAYLTSLLDIADPATAYLSMYGGAAAANNRWWRWMIGATGELTLQGGTDVGGGAFSLLSVGRTGVSAGSAWLEVFGGLTVDVDSGYSAAWDPAMRVRGVNPIFRMEDLDPGVDPECAQFGIWTRKDTLTDALVVNFGIMDSAGNSQATGRFLEAHSLGGAATQWTADMLYLRAASEVQFPTGTVNIVGDGGAPGVATGLALTGATTDLAGGAAGVTVQVNGGLAGNLVITGWAKVYFQGTTRYIPIVTTITP
ncbi:MAG: hypothetical protein WC713_11470, partial [Candidatus Methylomirabilota bacterium]